MAKSSGKVLEFFSQAYIIYLMFELISSDRGSDDLSFGFNHDSVRKQRELNDI